jgi:glycosyltransferase involved in cell wall biosynthesis
MTVGIDIRVLTRGTRTGVEEYTINLLSRLLRLDQNIDFKLFFNAYHKIKFNYDWTYLHNVKLSEFRIPNRLLFSCARYLNYPKIDSLLGGADIFFNPHFFNAPLSKRSRKVMTFHDLSFELHPELFSWRKRAWQGLLMNTKKEAHSADKIIAVSQSTKQDLVDLYKIDPDKIKVIHSGVGEEFIKMSDLECRMSNVIKKYHLPKKFILYFGTIEPRKNIAGLIRAFELLKEKNKDFKTVYLVIAGGKGWLFKNIFAAAARSKFAKHIIFTGFVSPEDKVYLYNLADLFVYPSFFEGFGFPPLEAMACGLPTITSNTSSLPEIAQDAALLVNPYDADELAWAIEQVLSDIALKKELARRSLAQAKLFSWNKCARETLNFLTQ